MLLKIIKMDIYPRPTAANGEDLRRFERLMGKDVIVEITDGTEKSRTANSYLWVLCDKIAEALHGYTKEQVYRKAISECGQWTDVEVKEEAFQSFCDGWAHNGKGWFVCEIGRDEFGMVTARAHYGSSTYTGAQLSRLIDWCVEECFNLDIPTLPEENLKSLIKTWEERHG